MMLKRIVYICIAFLILNGSGGLCCEVAAQVSVARSNKTEIVTGVPYYVHKVVRGQTLYSIARAYGVREDEILKANNKPDYYILKAREEILVPTSSEKRVNELVVKGRVVPDGGELQSVIAPEVTSKMPPKAGELKPKSEQGQVINTIVGDSLYTQEERGDVWKKGNERGGESNSINLYGDEIVGLFMISSQGGGIGRNEKDLFNGAKLAATKLRTQGLSVSVSCEDNWDKQPSYIVASEDVYSSGLQLAKQLRVPIVAPLVNATGSDAMEIQFAPGSGRKYEKFRDELNDPNNHVLLLKHTTYEDQVALGEMLSVLPFGVDTMGYNRFNKGSDIAMRLVKGKNNIIVVPVNHQGSVEDILSKITSINGLKKDFDIKVIGTNRWKNMTNLNPELLFKANISYPTTYHADRGDVDMASFYDQYINTYGELPNAFSMRGYDIVMVLSEAISKWQGGALANLPSDVFEPLQTPYRFYNSGINLINEEWVVVSMTPDYNIVTR